MRCSLLVISDEYQNEEGIKMFGWYKWCEKQEEKKRQQDLENMKYYTSGEAKRNIEWLSGETRKLREKKRLQEIDDHIREAKELFDKSFSGGTDVSPNQFKKENITVESLGQAHLSPFQKAELLKQSRIVSIAGVTEEPWMHLNLFDRKREYERIRLMTTRGEMMMTSKIVVLDYNRDLEMLIVDTEYHYKTAGDARKAFDNWFNDVDSKWGFDIDRYDDYTWVIRSCDEVERIVKLIDVEKQDKSEV